MATIIIKPASSCGNSKSRYKARRKAAQEQQRADASLARKIAVAVAGCSLKVAKATSLPGFREQHQGAVCLPEVAQFAAGHRKSTAVTAR